ncbi:hypothetical protein FA13DRAFT_1283972 [Coprinellus micaceus]|uniref:Uncharacterized protein n=1 Tax=Coprinellus micaceus TaxID=71717 RepID=A0A4Y7R7A3_COPMI|nr:hypothetical protein FA13DRAFT_1283972 [Coprinellus micaceus]
MSVSSDSRPQEAVDSGGLPITRDSETTIPSQPIEHDTEPGAMKLPTTTMTATLAAQEAKGAGAEDVVDIPAEVKPLDGVERVAGAVDDKAETGVDSDESRETALVPPQHTDFASETVKVTESNSTDSTPIESEEPREDTKEAVAIASTTPSTIEAREVVGVQDTKEEEKVADNQFESADAEVLTAQEIALSPTQESTSDAHQATRNTPSHSSPHHRRCKTS